LSVSVKNRIAGIASFDAAVHIVPLIEHAEFDGRILHYISIFIESSAKDMPYECEYAVQSTGACFGCDNSAVGTSGLTAFYDETLVVQPAGFTVRNVSIRL